ncbi:MAG TPA: hydrogenase maturation protease [Bacillota bacterium]|nr:hydrogenase maturation protease [Bacillota bacterium]
MGLGNSLMQDDGVGVHAVRRLMADPPPGALIMEVGTDVFTAVSWLESVPWVLAIDAMDAGGRPGTIYHCDISDVADANRPISLHELSLVAVLEFIPVKRRPKITVLGVQPEVVQYGLDLSPALEKCLPKVLEAAQAMVAEREARQVLLSIGTDGLKT